MIVSFYSEPDQRTTNLHSVGAEGEAQMKPDMCAFHKVPNHQLLKLYKRSENRSIILGAAQCLYTTGPIVRVFLDRYSRGRAGTGPALPHPVHFRSFLMTSGAGCATRMRTTAWASDLPAAETRAGRLLLSPIRAISPSGSAHESEPSPCPLGSRDWSGHPSILSSSHTAIYQIC